MDGDENTQAMAIQAIADAIEMLSYGTEHRPGGLEGLAMSIAGQELKHPLGQAIDDAAIRLMNPLDRIADALESIAYSLKQSRDA